MQVDVKNRLAFYSYCFNHIAFPHFVSLLALGVFFYRSFVKFFCDSYHHQFYFGKYQRRFSKDEWLQVLLRKDLCAIDLLPVLGGKTIA